MLIKNGTVLRGDFTLAREDVSVEGESISAGAGSGECFDASGLFVLPGLVDIHTHGVGEHECYDGGGAALKVARSLAAGGTTAFLPTCRGMDIEKLVSVTGEIAEIIEAGVPADCASPEGINLEGPFLSEAKRGAHPAEYLSKPDTALYARLREAAKGRVRLVTVAPECGGAEALIEEITKTAVASLGHSAADYETAKRAFARGASHVTHLFNAMLPMGHREPGLAGAALDSEGVTCELICDGEHVHPAAVRLAFKTLGAERVALISDSVAGAGLPQGEYVFRGVKHRRDGGKAVRLADGSLAGGGGFLLDNVRSAVEFGVPLADAVRAASLTPARVIGAEGRIGSIAAGKRADLILVDAELKLKAVVLRGRLLS
ncbi:MAG: N-acetylglucosamine-6-phosphate deacetylase [Clostridia bacterium]|nr:N-acetylglucosamine-6-phosphate deacetylase [Clostridia bacterium]